MDEDTIKEQSVLNTMICCLVHSLTDLYSNYLLNIVCYALSQVLVCYETVEGKSK